MFRFALHALYAVACACVLQDLAVNRIFCVRQSKQKFDEQKVTKGRETK